MKYSDKVTAYILHYATMKGLQMKYSELIQHHASKTKTQSFLVNGDMAAMTIRIPLNLRDAVAEAAFLKGMSQSAFVRSCLIEALASGGKR